MLLALLLVLFLGSTWCSASHEAFRFGDGEADASELNNRNLYIQEGAIIDVVCKEKREPHNYAYRDLFALYYYGVDYINTAWTLTSGVYNGPRVDSEGWGAAEVDGDTFPNFENWEAYNSWWTYDEPSFIWNAFGRHINTIRYTARMEDNGKLLSCRDKIAGFVDDNLVGGVYLVIRPPPAPLTFHSSVLHKWRGGFVGEIHIPISDYYTSWKIILEFKKNVYDLSGGHFQVANELCLHKRNCGDDRKKTWVIYNTFANRVVNPGDELHLIVYASTWKTIDSGLKATAHFYGYNQVYHVEGEPASSSSDIHLKFSASSSSSSSSSEEPIFAVPL